MNKIKSGISPSLLATAVLMAAMTAGCATATDGAGSLEGQPKSEEALERPKSPDYCSDLPAVTKRRQLFSNKLGKAVMGFKRDNWDKIGAMPYIRYVDLRDCENTSAEITDFVEQTAAVVDCLIEKKGGWNGGRFANPKEALVDPLSSAQSQCRTAIKLEKARITSFQDWIGRIESVKRARPEFEQPADRGIVDPNPVPKPKAPLLEGGTD